MNVSEGGEVSIIAKAHTDVDIHTMKVAFFDDTRYPLFRFVGSVLDCMLHLSTSLLRFNCFAPFNYVMTANDPHLAHIEYHVMSGCCSE